MVQDAHPMKTSPRINIAVSPLSWVNEVLHDLGAGTTAAQCLSEAASAGFQGVEMSRIFPRDAVQLQATLGEYSLQLASGWHDGFLTERDVEEELEAVAAHATLLRHCGASVMVYGECGWMADNALDIPLSQRRLLPAEKIPVYAARLTAFARQLHQRYGLKLAYHHHLMMVAEQLDEIKKVISACGEEVGLLLDTGHATAAGFDYAELIKAFPARICHVHLKDVRPAVLAQVKDQGLTFNQGVRAGMFTVPGDGSTNYQALAHFLATSNYQGWVVVEAEQDPAQANPLTFVTRAHQFVTQHILPQV